MAIQLAPEIEAALRKTASAYGVPVEGLVSEALKLFERERFAVPQVESGVSFNERCLEMIWTTHPDRRYHGQWVALEGSEVVAHGEDGRTVASIARSKGVRSPFLFFVEDPDPTPFTGGWLEPLSE
jgi:hypothetical protein